MPHVMMNATRDWRMRRISPLLTPEEEEDLAMAEEDMDFLKPEQTHQALIPGLPDDLGYYCLLRSSRFSIPRSRLVCRNWCDVLTNSDLYSWRHQLGLGEEWLYMCVASRRIEGRFDWHCFVPSMHTWLVLPPLPLNNEHGSVKTAGFGVTAVDGVGLFIAGGCVQGRGLAHVTVFDFRSGCWETIVHHAFRTRTDPVVVSHGRTVLIAGGRERNYSGAVETMEVIDADSFAVDSLECSQAMSMALVWCETLSFRQQLYARSRRDCLFGAAAGGGDVYEFNRDTNKWFQCPGGANPVSQAWKELMASVDGTLYMMDGSLSLYRWDEKQKGIGSWTKVGGERREIMFGYRLKKLVPCAGRLYAFVNSADTGKHSMLEVQVSEGDVQMSSFDLPGTGYYSAIACSRM